MKKQLRLILFALLILPWHSALAKEVTIDMSEQGWVNAYELTTVNIDGISLTFSKGKGQTTPKYYDSGSAARIYGGNTLTVSASETITNITMSFASSYAPSNSDFSVDVGQANLGTTTTWTGNSDNIVFTNTASKGHWRLTSMTVNVSDAPKLPEVTSIAELRDLEDGTQVRLNLGKDNPGKITFVHEGGNTEAFVTDNTASVSFKNFLPNDAGWHTEDGGALIGSVDGVYNFNNGMPEFTHISTSIADSILCLDDWSIPTPIVVDNLSELLGTSHRADYVAIKDMALRREGDNTYYLMDDNILVSMSNKFNMGDIIPDDLRGRWFNIQGILGATEDGSASELYYTQIDEIIPNLTFDENEYGHKLEIATYEGRSVNICVNRKLTTGYWNTLCLPFDIPDFSSIVPSAKLATLTGFNAAENSLEFTSTEDLLAGVPYLVYPTEDVDVICVQGANIQSQLHPMSYGLYEMIGIFDPTTLEAGDNSVLFLGDNNTLYYPNVTNDLKAFRAYFKTTAQEPARICIDGVLSDIKTVTLDGYDPNSRIYNVNGQMVGTSTDRLQKGVYVREGNKIIIK